MDEAKYFQHASAFKHHERFVITSNAKTEEGIWYLSKPIRYFAIHSNPAEIGNVVLASLESSQTRLPNSPSPTDLNQLMNDLYQIAGAPSLNTFLKDALHCGIGRSDEGIEISPTHNYGVDHEPGGFVFKFENRILVAESTPERLGHAFLQGFALCTSV